MEVHRSLGPGLLESTYRACLARELELGGIQFRQEVAVPIIYRGVEIENAYRADLIVDEQVA